ncbi:MAG: DUF4258 domain-containing protein [Rhizonema sp. PD37]|nr:DUF4258 domain-containing protein [Rhizonema sp. PD37]
MTNANDCPYTLTVHAQQVIAAREIEVEWIVRVLTQPQRTEPDREDSELRHALARIAEKGNRVLRVVYNETTIPWRIITVYFDRTQKNKL